MFALRVMDIQEPMYCTWWEHKFYCKLRKMFLSLRWKCSEHSSLNYVHVAASNFI